MTEMEDDIRSTPQIILQSLARVRERGACVAELFAGRPVQFLGCGSSYCVALVAAAIYEQECGIPAQAVFASDYQPRAGWTLIAITRTGQTTEVIDAMRVARDAGVAVGLLVGQRGSSAEALADSTVHLDFAPERGVVQTRFITAAIVALQQLIALPSGTLVHGGLAAAVECGLDEPLGLPTRPSHVVFLGRRERYGMAQLAALNLQETALVAAVAHQTLDYRHGPLALADANTLVWSFDNPGDAASAAVLEDVRKTGATVHCANDQPLVSLVQAQMTALRRALAAGLDPLAPRHLTRAVVLSAAIN